MGQVITIAQQKGGAGKTTLAVHLSVALAQAGLRVGILDIDPQGSASDWFEARQKFSGNNDLALQCTRYSDRWGLSFAINEMRELNDVVIIDTPPHTREQARICVREADLVIVPLQPSPTDLWASKSTIDLVNEENAETYVLLNRVVHNTRLASMFLGELPRKRFETTLANRVAYAAAMVEGNGVTEPLWAHTAAGLEMLELTKELASLMPGIIRQKSKKKNKVSA